MLVAELSPLNGQQKSFYGKAIVIQEGSTIILKSYDTFVAQIDNYQTESEKLTVHGTYSRTTLRHIIAFITRFGYNGSLTTTKEIMQAYGKGGTK